MSVEAVLVEWIDATQDSDTFSSPGRISSLRHTVGLLLATTPEGIYIAMSADEEGDFQFGFGIPHPYIRSVTQLVAAPPTEKPDLHAI